MKLSLFLLIILSCSTKTQNFCHAESKDFLSIISIDEIDNIEEIDFCDIKNHQNKLVRVKTVFSKIEEYSGLSPLDSCENKLNGFGWGVAFGSWRTENEKEVFDQFPNHELWEKIFSIEIGSEAILELVGIFKNTGEQGHLGTNEGEFVVKAIHLCRIEYYELKNGT